MGNVMSQTQLEKLTERVRGDLEEYFQDRWSRLRVGLRWLLEFLVTARPPEALTNLADSGAARGLRTHLGNLQQYLREECTLPEALCARYFYKLSEPRSRTLYKVRPRTWAYVHRLAKEVDWDPAVNLPLIPYDTLDWHDALEEQFVDLEVVLDSLAVEGMLISALEGYLSPRSKRRKGYEVYGVNLGMMRDVPHQRRRAGTRKTRYVSVMRSQPQLSAEAQYLFVEPNPRSLDAILTATRSLYPQFQAVGHFHSHPYRDMAEMESLEGWRFSESDEDVNRDFAEVMSRLHQRIAVTFIVSVIRTGQSVSRSHYRNYPNTIQMSINGCRVIIAAFRSLGSGSLTESNIRLGLSGMVS
ncbi:MAG: hypothetical protein JXA11_13560 [Phycisphaerae bacterium]|nr:hypothetical protein [Phycisphaerae bacterium]